MVARLVVDTHTVKAWANGRALGQLWAHEQLCKPELSTFAFMATRTSAGMCLATGATVGYLSI